VIHYADGSRAGKEGEGMISIRVVLTCVLVLALANAAELAGQVGQGRKNSYAGFDRNEYPGDANLAALRKTFAFAGYWLNAPPGAHENTWKGKRGQLRAAGFGFAVLFNGRSDVELKKVARAAELGRSDAEAAVDAARREGFPPNTVIFLDQEEGGRMLPEQKAYIFAWVDGVNGADFRAGIYCSGIAARGGSGDKMTTAEDIRQSSGGRKIVFWIANDGCPPSPGCALGGRIPAVTESGIPFASVWQYAQSPRRKEMTGSCSKSYAPEGNCYPPGLGGAKIFVDLNTASERDPSGGR
jgi:hypothetical protein